RGRVGRSARRGYAYLLSDPETANDLSQKRLRALEDLAQLGAGFRISQLDLDLRGAGDLFGEDQAGHLKLVGPALYRHLLDRAVKRARDEPVLEDYIPDLRLEVTGRIPADYIRDEQTRLEIHARSARVADEGEIDRLAGEIEDR